MSTEISASSSGNLKPFRPGVFAVVLLVATLVALVNPLLGLIPSFCVAGVCLSRLWRVPQIFFWALAIPFAFALWLFAILVLNTVFVAVPLNSLQRVAMFGETIAVAAILVWAISTLSRAALLALIAYQIIMLIYVCYLMFVFRGSLPSAVYAVRLIIHVGGLFAVSYALLHYGEWQYATAADGPRPVS